MVGIHVLQALCLVSKLRGASGFDSQISTTEPTAGFCDTWPFRDLFLCKTFMRSTGCAL